MSKTVLGVFETIKNFDSFKKQPKLYIKTIAVHLLSSKGTKLFNLKHLEKTPNFGRYLCTLNYACKLKLRFSETLILLQRKIHMYGALLLKW